MGYAGQTFLIPQSAGGFQYRYDLEYVEPTMLVGESRNFNLHRDGRQKRGGTIKTNYDPSMGTSKILGLFDFRLQGKSFQVFSMANGNLYFNTPLVLYSGLSTTNYTSFVVFNDELYFCDGETEPRTWDGNDSYPVSYPLTTPALDWTGTNQPFQFIVHGRGNSRRLWALMKNGVYFSSTGDGKEFDGGSSGLITIETGDAFGLVGGVEFGDRLIVFSRTKAFIIDDEDADSGNWGYQAAQWEGGAAHWRLIVKTPNDVAVMTEDGDIYSFSAVQSYGDYKQASIARPAYIDTFLKEKAVMSKIEDFHAIYDPTLRAIKFFISVNDATKNDTGLVYFIDRSPDQAWAIHDNRDYASGYNASCSALVRTAPATYYVYTGGYDGFIWKLEDSGYEDDGNTYPLVLRTPRLIMGDVRRMKEFKRAIYTVMGAQDVSFDIKIIVDGEDNISEEFTTTASAWDQSLFDEALFDYTFPVRESFDIGQKGRTLEIELQHETINQPIMLSSFMIDFKMLGAAPK
jgi:hypothetical protein